MSFEIPESTCELTALGTVRLLGMVRTLPRAPRLFHAASSEIFGQPVQSPPNEQTPMSPINPHGCAKAFAAQMVTLYRNTYGLFAGNGIMYNHESPRRGENFMTRKICRAAAAIKLGLGTELLLGDTAAQRDWGHSRDYVRSMWFTLQHATPDDYVFATGQLHSVQDVVEAAFAVVELDWKRHVKQGTRFPRPAEPLHRLFFWHESRMRMRFRHGALTCSRVQASPLHRPAAPGSKSDSPSILTRRGRLQGSHTDR